jgi:hypothetical protein
MSEEDKNKDAEDKRHKEQVTIVVDRSKELEDLQKQLQAVEADAKAKKAEVEKLTKEKIDSDAEKNNLITEKEHLEGTLKTIAEKEFNTKRNILMARVKTVFSRPEDEKRIKEIEDKLNDPDKGPENLKQTEYMIGVLDEALQKGKVESEAAKKLEDDKKKAAQAGERKPAPQGGDTAPLSNEQITGEKSEEEGYDSNEAMIRDLNARARDPRDPAKQAEAQAILKELWKKWAMQIKKDFEGRTGQNQTDYTEEKEEGEFQKLQGALKSKPVKKEGA